MPVYLRALFTDVMYIGEHDVITLDGMGWRGGDLITILNIKYQSTRLVLKMQCVCFLWPYK